MGCSLEQIQGEEMGLNWPFTETEDDYSRALKRQQRELRKKKKSKKYSKQDKWDGYADDFKHSSMDQERF